jgi:hypothetical protein
MLMDLLLYASSKVDTVLGKEEKTRRRIIKAFDVLNNTSTFEALMTRENASGHACYATPWNGSTKASRQDGAHGPAIAPAVDWLTTCTDGDG